MPEYVPFDGKPVSRAWHSVLTAARRDGVNFHLNSGHRTMDEQRALFAQNMIRPGVPKPGRPLTAVPDANAPHVRIGRLDHALDVRDENLFSPGGGAERLMKWGGQHHIDMNRTVPSEAWHLEASEADLRGFYEREQRRERRRRRRERRRDLIRWLRTRRVSKRGRDLVAEFEGFAKVKPGNPDLAFPYQDPVGVWTIGYGHTKNVGPNTKPWSRAKAKRVLKRELNHGYAPAVRALKLPLNQAQLDALTSFVFNLGPGAIGRDTGIGRALRNREWQKAADEMLEWNKAGGTVLPGLTRRRQAERKLFLSGKEAR